MPGPDGRAELGASEGNVSLLAADVEKYWAGSLHASEQPARQVS